jgi:ACS family hexuronate transporter-like MFS transporter
MGLTFPADLYSSGAVATVTGISGVAAGAGTIVSTFLIGRITDSYSFEPVLIGASFLPLIATILLLVLIRPSAEFKKP